MVSFIEAFLSELYNQLRPGDAQAFRRQTWRPKMMLEVTSIFSVSITRCQVWNPFLTLCLTSKNLRDFGSQLITQLLQKRLPFNMRFSLFFQKFNFQLV